MLPPTEDPSDNNMCWVIEFQQAPMHHISEAVMHRLSLQISERRAHLVSKTQARSGVMSGMSTLVYVSAPKNLFDHTVDATGILVATKVEEEKLFNALFRGADGNLPANSYKVRMHSDPGKPACPSPSPGSQCYDPYIEVAPSSSCMLL